MIQVRSTAMVWGISKIVWYRKKGIYKYKGYGSSLVLASKNQNNCLFNLLFNKSPKGTSATSKGYNVRDHN